MRAIYGYFFQTNYKKKTVSSSFARERGIKIERGISFGGVEANTMKLDGIKYGIKADNLLANINNIDTIYHHLS